MKRERRAATRRAAWQVLSTAVSRLSLIDCSSEAVWLDRSLNDAEHLREVERVYHGVVERLERWVNLNKPRGT